MFGYKCVKCSRTALLVISGLCCKCQPKPPKSNKTCLKCHNIRPIISNNICLDCFIQDFIEECPLCHKRDILELSGTCNKCNLLLEHIGRQCKLCNIP